MGKFSMRSIVAELPDNPIVEMFRNGCPKGQPFSFLVNPYSDRIPCIQVDCVKSERTVPFDRAVNQPHRTSSRSSRIIFLRVCRMTPRCARGCLASCSQPSGGDVCLPHGVHPRHAATAKPSRRPKLNSVPGVVQPLLII
jgi:hypothetical protein